MVNKHFLKMINLISNVRNANQNFNEPIFYIQQLKKIKKPDDTKDVKGME